jgi:hypothetical protein
MRQRESHRRADAKILQRPECAIDPQRLLRHHHDEGAMLDLTTRLDLAPVAAGQRIKRQ